MRSSVLAVATLCLTGCMCRPGVVDCTTNRSYPGYCKPLCGGPLDPFVWFAGDCSTCCCCSYKCGYLPYGGQTCCGDEMVYTPSCISPPLQWAAPAVPGSPSGHIVHLPPAPRQVVPPTKSDGKGGAEDEAAELVPAAPPAAPPADADSRPAGDADLYEPPLPATEDEFAPSVKLRDARNESPLRSRR